MSKPRVRPLQTRSPGDRIVMLGNNVNLSCEAMMNTHLAMGWSTCGKPASRIVTKGVSDFALCDEHARQNADLPQRAVESSGHSSPEGDAMNAKRKGLPGFRITMKHGFHITFENGYTVSVQFGPGNYCDHYNRGIGRDDEASGKEGSSDAETAVWGPDGGMIERDGDTVQGYQSPAQVLELLNWASSQSAVETKP